MSLFKGMFSENYSEYLNYRDKVKALVLSAKQEIEGSTLYGHFVDTKNPEDIIAVLYLLYKDKELFHEAWT